MRDKWVNMNVDLDALAELIKQFFEGKGFEVSVEKRKDGHRIIASPIIGSKLCDNVEVLVYGKPNDFTVEFGPSTGRTKAFTWLGGLAQLFGGGYLLYMGIRSQEEFDKLENEFWNFLDAKLPSLARR